MARKISLAAITLTDVPTDEAVRIAAETGYAGISISAGLNASLGRNKRVTVINDVGLRRATERALGGTGIDLDLVEGLAVEPNVDFERVREGLLVMRDLGARLFNLTVWDGDRARAMQTMRRYCGLADELGFGLTVEFTPLSRLGTLAETVALIQTGELPGMKILPDPLHLARADETPADLAAIDSALIGLAQLCDGPAHSPGHEAYLEEALHNRQSPGEGELPLRDFVRALPPDIVISVEVPSRPLTEQGLTAYQRAERFHAGARSILESAEAV